MERNIIIKQEYFTNIKTAIDSLNEFFSSGFKVKNFPVLDGDFQLDPTVEKIISRLNSVDPTWLMDESRLNGVIQSINEGLKGINPVDGVYATIVNSNNETMINAIDAYVGFKTLQLIADNFQEFTKFINGIYTFEVFTKPSQYIDVLDLFGQFIQLNDIPELDLEEKIFDEGFYVDGIIKSDQIIIPEDLTIETETERLINRQDLTDIEVFVDDSVQEAAEVNYFENSKPAHMQYSEKSKKWEVSRQFEKFTNDLIAGLRKCDTTDDLKNFFSSSFWSNSKIDPCEMGVAPFILVNVMTNAKKFPYDTFDTEKYSDSYKSIIKQNNGAKRFRNYDLFSTFKSDKEGTIKFIEDFLKLKLVNDPDAAIENNTLLTIFNIFDSRIYLDLAYNVAPESIRNEKGEDAFVKEIRGKINKNSRTKTAYSKKEDEKNDEETKPDTTETVSEYVSSELDALGDMTPTDMQYCEHYAYLVEREIDTIGDRMFNEGISPFLIEEYIGESFYDINSQAYDVFEEASMRVKRDAFQQGVCSLMANMEEIAKLDKEHRWNANTLGSRYKTTFNPLTMFLLPAVKSITNSAEGHTNIKQVHHSTKKALKGKRGSFTPEQLRTIQRLHDLVGDLWATVKLFWINPRNWAKELNLMKNDKTQKRTKKMAEIAREIVALKPKLDFIIDNDDFVNEYWYDGSPDYVFQEATTEVNKSRLGTAIDLLIRDMKAIAELAKNKQWTNNACITRFKGETIGNVKQAIKYANRGIGGSCGRLEESDVSTLKDLRDKLEELLRSVRTVKANPLIGKSIKEAGAVRKIATLAGEIAGMESSLGFTKEAAVKGTTSSKDTSSSEENSESVQESVEYDIDKFKLIMEQEDGSIPEYMKTRLKMSDDIKTTVSPTDLPSDVPQNPISDLTDSIDTQVNSGGDDIGEMLGSGFDQSKLPKGESGKIVINVTNNYSNSFNRDSGNTTTTTSTNDDHSTGKVTNTSVTNTNSNNNTNSHNNSSHDNQTDSSSNKSIKRSNVTKKNSKVDSSNHSKSARTEGSNNNNNSNGSVDTKDSPTFKDGEQKLSSGKTIQEMFMFLESKEPQSNGNNAGDPPKEDLLTKAMDKDRETLAKQQGAKKGLTKALNTGKAVLKPVTRTKQWLTKVVDSVIKRDEDKVKAEIIENDSYRSSVYKAARLALKLGMTGLFFSIQPYLGATYVAVQGLKAYDKQRLKKEVQQEMEAELEVINEKIEDLSRSDKPEDLKKKYEYMRMKKKVEQQILKAPGSTIRHPRYGV